MDRLFPLNLSIAKIIKWIAVEAVYLHTFPTNVVTMYEAQSKVMHDGREPLVTIIE